VAAYLTRVVQIVRTELLYGASVPQLLERMDDAGVWPPAQPDELPKLLSLLPEIISVGEEEASEGVVDFTDMICLPLRRSLPLPPFDLIAVDEAQDYSAAAVEFMLRFATFGSRL